MSPCAWQHTCNKYDISSAIDDLRKLCYSSQISHLCRVSRESVERMLLSGTGQQVPLQGRDLPSTKAFKGRITFAGRHQGTECCLVTQETAANKVTRT